MRALLLAAGLGTRLQPLTHHLPKCLVPIHGRPLLDYWLETLLDHGVEQVLINTHYMTRMVEEYVSLSTWASRVTLVNEETLLGTGGTVLQNRDFFRDESFLVGHADNLTIFDMQMFAKRHADRPSHAEMTMMLFETDTPQSCGIVTLDAQGVVQEFHEKVPNPPGKLANAAVYIFEPSVVDWMASLGKCVVDLSTEVIPSYLGRIATYHNRKYHRDIGTLESWQEANRDFPHLAASASQNQRAWHEVVSRSPRALAEYLGAMSTAQ